jgi:hypothetical protein
MSLLLEVVKNQRRQSSSKESFAVPGPQASDTLNGDRS